MLAIEESVSMDCARVVRGTASVENAVIRRAARVRTTSGFRSGIRDPRRIVPGRIHGISSRPAPRSEEHTSELQSLAYLVCRLLLEKKKKRYRHPRGCQGKPAQTCANSLAAAVFRLTGPGGRFRSSSEFAFCRAPATAPPSCRLSAE